MADVLELADKLKSLKDNEKNLKADLKGIQEKIEQLDAELSNEMMNEEMQNFSRGGFLFYLNTKTHASAVAENKQDLFQRLKDAGYGDLVYETVNANSLSSFVKEQIEQNEDMLPDWLDGIVNVYEKTTVGIRKAAK